eukprot:scaffold305133_cov68-Attheya_sp.AAC.1
MSDVIEKRIRSGMKEDREDVGERKLKSITRSGPQNTAVSRGKDSMEAVPEEDLSAAKLAQLQCETLRLLSETRNWLQLGHVFYSLPTIRVPGCPRSPTKKSHIY